MDFSILFTIGLKIVEWVLNRTKMREEQKKAFLQFIKDSQKRPQESVRLNELVDQQTAALAEKKRAMREAQKAKTT